VQKSDEEFVLPTSMQPNASADPKETKETKETKEQNNASEDAFDLGVAYAGCGSVFGGKGNECANCRESEPINVIVDITTTLTTLGLSRNQVKLVVVCEDERGLFARLEDLIGQGIRLVLPSIVGPMFEQSDIELKKDDKWADMPENQDVKQLQKWLKLHGYYDGTIDGKFGPMTEESVALFQSIAGIAETSNPSNTLELTNVGVFDRATKRALVAPRHDHKKDVNVEDAMTYESGTEVKYVVGWAPGYLSRAHVLSEVERAIQLWSTATGVRFSRLDRRMPNMTGVVVVEWMDNSKEDMDALLRFDGPGGTLANATKDFIHLDAAELWCTPHTPSKPNAFNIFRYVRCLLFFVSFFISHTLFVPFVARLFVTFFPNSVVLHEMGHVLGLGHSKNPEDVMSPWYNASLKALTQNDIDRAKMNCKTPFNLGGGGKSEEKKTT